jgi:anthranilate synthase/aminodeoxychorismate synthase-like glutamine amidotransferase
MAPSHLCISPGPGTPYDAGVSMDMIRAFAGQVPVFGVCLGHQSIVEVFGGKVVRAPRLMHGKTSPVAHDGKGLFAGLSANTEVGRYHSLIAKADTLPAELEITARTPEGEIMGVRHRTLKVEGVQFHPESVLTPEGPKLIGNFLTMTGGRQ